MNVPSSNPYDFSHPVTDPLLFAGRRELLADVSYYLDQAAVSEQPVGLAFIGPRAVGKTSLLNVVAAWSEAKGFLVVRLDLDESDTDSPLTFFHRLVEDVLSASIQVGAFDGEGGQVAKASRSLAFGENLVDVRPGAPLRVSEAWASAVRSGNTHLSLSTSFVVSDLQAIQAELGKSIVILIDEADTISANPAILQKLRNVFQRASGYLVVLAGTDALFPELDRVFSPVSRQFKTVSIGPFDDPRETEDCVVMPLRKAGLDPSRILDARAYDSLHEVARGRPYEVKLLCHFMFRRVQIGTNQRMELDLAVLEDVRRQLERERNVASRPVLSAVKGLDRDQLIALSILVEADRNATLEELWQAEYAIHGMSRVTEHKLRERCGELVQAGILRVENSRVAFVGDEFDRLYVTYFAREREVGLSFPPLSRFPLDLYWEVTLRAWLGTNDLFSIGMLRGGEERRQLDDLALVRVLNALSGVDADFALVEQEIPLAADLHALTSDMQDRDEIPVYRIRVRLGSVDITGLFCGPAATEPENRVRFESELDVVTRVAEMHGSVESELFMLPIYSFARIVDTVAEKGSPALRRLLALHEAALARASTPRKRPGQRLSSTRESFYGTAPMCGR